eukprot:CAMPEP_0196776124 /NCGR_PEP_ID=MMETSP1104-20130614/4441_1 /TAXON_ID=33652 /ORGANISM="Cafeteria sp., Strain Caron Lab Isolate" /LENGTH=76 /DNA_ID=CAMNT_0042146295 /DNA_START=265 /DNA_END=493 /DNA_ORIENTATION=+
MSEVVAREAAAAAGEAPCPRRCAWALQLLWRQREGLVQSLPLCRPEPLDAEDHWWVQQVMRCIGAAWRDEEASVQQ